MRSERPARLENLATKYLHEIFHVQKKSTLVPRVVPDIPAFCRELVVALAER